MHTKQNYFLTNIQFTEHRNRFDTRANPAVLSKKKYFYNVFLRKLSRVPAKRRTSTTLNASTRTDGHARGRESTDKIWMENCRSERDGVMRMKLAGPRLYDREWPHGTHLVLVQSLHKLWVGAFLYRARATCFKYGSKIKTLWFFWLSKWILKSVEFLMSSQVLHIILPMLTARGFF